MLKTRLKMFFKVINKTNQKEVLKGSLTFMHHFNFVNWRIGGLENSFFEVTNRLFHFRLDFGFFKQFHKKKLSQLFEMSEKIANQYIN